MGVSSHVIVAVGKEKTVDIINKVSDALSKWQRAKLDVAWKEKGYKNRLQFTFSDEGRENWTNGIRLGGSDLHCLTLNFKVNGENRILHYLPTCYNDHKDLAEESVIFSLNPWGLHKEIMDVVIKASLEFGDVYYQENDCEGEPIKIENHVENS